MKNFVKSWQFRIICGLAAFCLGFMIYAGLSGKLANLPANIVGWISTPIQKVTGDLVHSVGNYFDSLFRAAEIKEENQALKEENNKLQEQLANYHAALRENNNLKDYIGLKEENPNWVMQSASVVERDPSSQYGTFSVNRGSLHGISPRDVVITADGLVGVISEVGWSYSTVQTILNPDLSVGCICSRTGDTGTSGGRLSLSLDGLTALGYINKTSGMQPGDLIITGGSDHFPANLILGKVQSVSLAGNGSSLEAVLLPAVDIKGVQEVMILTDFYGKAKEEQE